MASDVQLKQMNQWSITLILSAVFIISAVMKLTDPQLFVRDISYYRLLPAESLNILAIWLIMLEFVVGIALLFGTWRQAAAALAAVLFFLFILMIGLAMARGLDISCGCFGAGSQKVGWPKMIENILLLGGALWLVKNNK